MKFRMLQRNIKQGFVGMWRNRTMSIASISSVAATLLILGIVLLIVINTNYAMTILREDFDQVKVFLKDELTISQIESIGEEIIGYKNVVNVDYKSKADSLEEMKREWGEDATILEGLEEDNPLPAAFVVSVDKLENVETVVKKINQIEGIEEVKYYNDIVDKLIMMTNVIKKAGMVVIVILIFVSIFIINNTIKITIAARNREIAIMKHVGATNGFIRGPFIVEGILLGIVGSVIACLIIGKGYSYVLKMINEKLYFFFTVYFMPYEMIIWDIVAVFIAIGVGIGVVGSIISLKKYLKV